jgi:hypothetical protein
MDVHRHLDLPAGGMDKAETCGLLPASVRGMGLLVLSNRHTSGRSNFVAYPPTFMPSIINSVKQVSLIARLALLALGFGAYAAAPTPDFNGNWTCLHGRQKIPGALTQRGAQVDGFCIYPDGKRASFKGTVKGSTLSGTLYVDKNTERTITATLSGNTMRGNWKARGSGGGPWNATRSEAR